MKWIRKIKRKEEKTVYLINERVYVAIMLLSCISTMAMVIVPRWIVSLHPLAFIPLVLFSAAGYVIVLWGDVEAEGFSGRK